MSLLDDPDYLPFKLDLASRRVLLLRLTAAQRAEAAFLDERALPADAQAAWLPLSMLGDRLPRPPAPAADFIFHIGHCGSTLLARLLQAWAGVQVLREPLPLRTLAQAFEHDAGYADREGGVLLQQLLTLWSRPYAGATRTVVKATSSCNALVAPVLAAAPGRAVLLDQPLASYLATLFKAGTSIADALAAEPGRRADLARRIAAAAPPLHAETVAERCALGWLAERVRFQALAQAHGARVLRVDFEALLARPDHVLAAIAAHLQLAPQGVAAALAAPDWQRYSKAPSHAYDGADRQHDLALAGQRFGSDIDAGRRWLDGFLQRHPQFTEAVG